MSKTLLARICWPFALLLFAPQLLISQPRPADGEQEEVRRFLSEFITAFDNLDWQKFRNAFADDATVFYPRGRPNSLYSNSFLPWRQAGQERIRPRNSSQLTLDDRIAPEARFVSFARSSGS